MEEKKYYLECVIRIVFEPELKVDHLPLRKPGLKEVGDKAGQVIDSILQQHKDVWDTELLESAIFKEEEGSYEYVEGDKDNFYLSPISFSKEKESL